MELPKYIVSWDSFVVCCSCDRSGKGTVVRLKWQGSCTLSFAVEPCSIRHIQGYELPAAKQDQLCVSANPEPVESASSPVSWRP